MFKTLHFGATGIEVIGLQAMLNSKPTTALPSLSIDGIFGPKTLAGVREFQKNNGLQVDGIVGPLTWRKLLAGWTGSSGTYPYCDNTNPLNLSSAAAAAADLRSASGFSSDVILAGFPSLPSLPSLPKLRPLKGAPEEAIATSVYGSSIDTSRVTLSDKTGLGGLAFVLGVPDLIFGRHRQIMNVGPMPSRSTMIHELAHVWQSQHASDVTSFMTNSVKSQALAAAANLTFRGTSFSAYGYRPGKPFGDYGAEQIAQQAMNGETAILSHMKGVAVLAIDSDNETSLKTARIEDTSSPGVKI